MSPASHFLLTELLRRQWGFRGYVTSDCDAVYNILNPHHYAASQPIASAMAILAGCDVDCGGTMQRNLLAAVGQELISENDIGLAITRLLTVRHLLGVFDPPGNVLYTQIPFEVVDSPGHKALALEAARQSLVLLKNDSSFLPLDKRALKKIALIGPLAGTCHLGGYSGVPTVRVSPLQGIAEHLGVNDYLPFVFAADSIASSGETVINSSPDGEVYISFLADGSSAQYPKTDFTGKTDFHARMSGSPDGSYIEVRLDTLDGPLACTLTPPKPVRGQRWFAVSAPLAGISGEHFVVLKYRGSTNPLNIVEFQLNPVSAPSTLPGQTQLIFKPGCTVTGAKDETTFNEAVDAARDADAVILVCGVNGEVGREGHDRENIDLSGVQSNLIQAIYAVNPKIVLVLSTNNSVAINWEQTHLPAILCATCAGQAQGAAIAEALFGDYNPGGKLPCTWYRSVDQLPPFHDYDIKKGRTYMYFEGDPLYPFGHGLSYTAFKLDQLHLTATKLGLNQKTTISVVIANIGDRAGAEVVQLYISPPSTFVKRPSKQLAGFQRVELQPGETKTVVFELPYSELAFWYWNEEARQFVCQPGIAKILIGNSSANLVLSQDVMLAASDETQSKPKLIDTIAVKSRVRPL